MNTLFTYPLMMSPNFVIKSPKKASVGYQENILYSITYVHVV